MAFSIISSIHLLVLRRFYWPTSFCLPHTFRALKSYGMGEVLFFFFLIIEKSIVFTFIFCNAGQNTARKARWVSPLRTIWQGIFGIQIYRCGATCKSIFYAFPSVSGMERWKEKRVSETAALKLTEECFFPKSSFIFICFFKVLFLHFFSFCFVFLSFKRCVERT